ncbi:MAG: peptide ABC transporter substrate-binding protein [Alphaproteobacteria bacterium]|nr:peptide ABC transporter substrate-binding protein [Alphaproteobacteria bacterium]
MKRTLLARTLLALAAVLSPATAPTAFAAKDELVIGMTQYPATLHPNIESMLAKTLVNAATRRPFTAYDAKWQLTCMLCVALPTIENGLARLEDLPDGKQGIAVTYTIQPNAKWGDGTPVTTRDVLFSWEVGRHPQSGVAAAEFYRRAYKLDVKDQKTFTLHFDRVTYEYNAIGDFQVLPAHIEAAHFAEPAQYRNRTRFDADPTNAGLHFGPYRIVEVRTGSHIVLEPNPTWYGEKPKFKRVVFRAVENTSALEANLLSGSIDYITGELGLTLDQGLAFEKKHADKYDVIFKPGLIYEHIDMRLDHPALKDLRVRQALLMALDRRSISTRLFGGKQPVATTSVNPLDWVHAADLKGYDHDPKRAAQLLDEAGWKAGPGGMRQNAGGEKLAIELMTTAGNRVRETVQQVLQAQWKQVGVDVRLKNEPPRVFFGETVTKRQYTGMAMYAWVSAPESVPRSTLHSGEIPRPENNWAGQNYTGYASKAMDELVEKIEVELDRGKRKALWRQLQELYLADLPVLPLYFRADVFVIPKWLKGVTPTGHRDPSTMWIEHWRAE